MFGSRGWHQSLPHSGSAVVRRNCPDWSTRRSGWCRPKSNRFLLRSDASSPTPVPWRKQRRPSSCRLSHRGCQLPPRSARPWSGSSRQGSKGPVRPDPHPLWSLPGQSPYRNRSLPHIPSNRMRSELRVDRYRWQRGNWWRCAPLYQWQSRFPARNLRHWCIAAKQHQGCTFHRWLPDCLPERHIRGRSPSANFESERRRGQLLLQQPEYWKPDPEWNSPPGSKNTLWQQQVSTREIKMCVVYFVWS